MLHGLVTRYYERYTMSPELREAISITFDENMTLLGKKFAKRVTWIFDKEMKKQLYALYGRRYDHRVRYNGKMYDWELRNGVRIPVVYKIF